MEIGAEKYIIFNVPFNDEHCDEAVYDLDVTLKLLMLKELIEAEEILSEIDFHELIDISFR